jgi:hypothetical protein
MPHHPALQVHEFLKGFPPERRLAELNHQERWLRRENKPEDREVLRAIALYRVWHQHMIYDWRPEE